MNVYSYEKIFMLIGTYCQFFSLYAEINAGESHRLEAVFGCSSVGGLGGIKRQVVHGNNPSRTGRGDLRWFTIGPALTKSLYH